MTFFGMKAIVDSKGICHFENGKSYDLKQPIDEFEDKYMNKEIRYIVTVIYGDLLGKKYYFDCIVNVQDFISKCTYLNMKMNESLTMDIETLEYELNPSFNPKDFEDEEE